MRLNQIKKLNEAEKNEIQFKDTEPRKPLPDLIYNKIKRKVRDGAKDYDQEWNNAMDLVDWSLEELNINKPLASDPRWSQYLDLIKEAVKELHKARGDKFRWKLGV